MIFKPFGVQQKFLMSKARIVGGFAGKRGGKTEVGAVRAIRFTEDKIGFKDNDRDPYKGAIIAPTFDMLRRLSMDKFTKFAAPFGFKMNETRQEITWHNGSEILGISGEKPERMEGLKLNWVWLDEAFQLTEHMFLESIARVADNEGFVWVTSSLGVQYNNPKNHWAHKYFKENPMQGTETYEWATLDNPYFPKDEIERLKDHLDPRTFKQMFTIDWDTPPTNVVYDNITEDNFIDVEYNPGLQTYVSIDWGWNNECACLFFQYDAGRDTVFLIDEIVKSKLLLDKLYEEMKRKPYKINEYYCDSAGNQTREQTGVSNVLHFRTNYNINFKYRSTAVRYGIPIVRSYIRNSKGQTKFYISNKCKKSIDQIRNYHYAEKNGILQEDPEKNMDHTCDAIRYFFVNRLDKNRDINQFGDLDRWQLTKF